MDSSQEVETNSEFFIGKPLQELFTELLLFVGSFLATAGAALVLEAAAAGFGPWRRRRQAEGRHDERNRNKKLRTVEAIAIRLEAITTGNKKLLYSSKKLLLAMPGRAEPGGDDLSRRALARGHVLLGAQ